MWKGKILATQPDRIGVEFSYFSKDGEEGFPGNMTCRVTYWLTKTNELKIQYYAATEDSSILGQIIRFDDISSP